MRHQHSKTVQDNSRVLPGQIIIGVKVLVHVPDHRELDTAVVEVLGGRRDKHGPVVQQDTAVQRAAPGLVHHGEHDVDLSTDRVVRVGDGRVDVELLVSRPPEVLGLGFGSRELDGQPWLVTANLVKGKI